MVKNIIFLRPKWNDRQVEYTNARFMWVMDYVHWFLQPAYDHAVKKYPAEAITTLEGEACTPGAVSRLLREKKGLVFHASHGASNALTANAGELMLSCFLCTEGWSCVLPEFENTDVLANDIFYTASCLSARNLGPEVINAGCNTYMGYADLFWFVVGTEEATWHLEEIFQDILSSGAIALLNGKSPKAARKVVIGRMLHWLDEYKDDRFIIGCLQNDLYGFRLLEGKIPEIPERPPVSTELLIALVIAVAVIIGIFAYVMLRR